jgi:hypothetical protein
VTRTLPLERIVGLDTEKAVRARMGVRLFFRVPNIFEWVKILQPLALVVFIPVKGIVLITVVLKALECIVILGRVAMEMKTPVHRASCDFPKRANNTVPTERLA